MKTLKEALIKKHSDVRSGSLHEPIHLYKLYLEKVNGWSEIPKAAIRGMEEVCKHVAVMEEMPKTFTGRVRDPKVGVEINKYVKSTISDDNWLVGLVYGEIDKDKYWEDQVECILYGCKNQPVIQLWSQKFYNQKS